VAQIRVLELVFTDTGEDKLWYHGITTDQAQSVLLGSVVVTRNRAGRSAPYVLIGRDEHGRCLTLPIVPTDQWGVWRVITGWPCEPSEAARLR
jgi:hypothetical protein